MMKEQPNWLFWAEALKPFMIFILC